MQYRGDLYAKIGRKYLKLEMNSDDVDNMSKRIKELEEENEKLKKESFRHKCGFCIYNDHICTEK